MYIYISYIYYYYYYYYYIIIIFHLKDWFPWPISVHGTRKGKGYCQLLSQKCQPFHLGMDCWDQYEMIDRALAHGSDGRRVGSSQKTS